MSVYGSYINEGFGVALDPVKWIDITESFISMESLLEAHINMADATNFIMESDAPDDIKKKFNIKEVLATIGKKIKEAWDNVVKWVKEKYEAFAKTIYKFYMEHSLVDSITGKILNNTFKYEEIEKAAKNGVFDNAGHMAYPLNGTYDALAIPAKLVGTQTVKIYEELVNSITQKIDELDGSKDYSDALKIYEEISLKSKDLKDRIKNQNKNNKSNAFKVVKNLMAGNKEKAMKFDANDDISKDIEVDSGMYLINFIDTYFKTVENKAPSENEWKEFINIVSNSNKNAKKIKDMCNAELNNAKNDIKKCTDKVSKLSEDSNRAGLSTNNEDGEVSIDYSKTILLSAKAELQLAKLNMDWINYLIKSSLMINVRIANMSAYFLTLIYHICKKANKNIEKEAKKNESK